MSTVSETSDAKLIELLRQSGPLGIAELVTATGVTPTAVRQRLNRLMAQGLVERRTARAQRGRPSHKYSLTLAARRQAGTNFADLAIVLWEQLKGISDPEVKRGLLKRLSSALADRYAERISGHDVGERMDALCGVLAERKVPFSVNKSGTLPVLTAHDCPYPELAEQDRSICAMERLLFSELLASDVRLTQCRLDGSDVCQFATS